jgi:hypothetical protein
MKTCVLFCVFILWIEGSTSLLLESDNDDDERDLYEGIAKGLLASDSQVTDLINCPDHSNLNTFRTNVGNINSKILDKQFSDSVFLTLKDDCIRANGVFLEWYKNCISEDGSDLNSFASKMADINWETRLNTLSTSHSELKSRLLDICTPSDFTCLGKYVGGSYYLLGDSADFHLTFFTICVFLLILF